MNTKITLLSDFTDYYDHWFDSRHDNPELVIERYTNSGFNRIEMLTYLKSIGFMVPVFTQDRKTVRWSFYKDGVVCFTSLNEHQGKGKRLCTHQEFKNNEFDFIDQSVLFMRYIPTSPMGESYRLINFGNESFVLRYQSNDWRSNCGNDISITVLEKKPKYLAKFKNFQYPISAIDFVKDKDSNKFFAIDFNIAPSVKGTGLDNIISGKEIVESVKRWVDDS